VGSHGTLYLAVREQGLRDVELAKRLGVSETVVRRMLDLNTTRNRQTSKLL
jgi:DNA-binding transcriptional regulator LsrR (DeoR family)